MWKPSANFITLHYVYILSFGILALIVLYPAGNLSAIDAYFFGVSASTESGLNPVDLKSLDLYQQIYLYITPLVTNLCVINVVVVVVRLRWFGKRFKDIAEEKERRVSVRGRAISAPFVSDNARKQVCETKPPVVEEKAAEVEEKDAHLEQTTSKSELPRIQFAPEPQRDDRSPNQKKQLPPDDIDDDEIRPSTSRAASRATLRRKKSDTLSMSKAASVDRAVSSIFVLGSTSRSSSQNRSRKAESIDLSALSPEELGGIEYRALKVLFKVATGYYVGLHLFGVIGLLPWIHTADPKYTEYLASQGQNKSWWAIYTSQTMINNLGLTLTPDSMVSFRDATWPMLLMSFLALAGNTFYPVFLRLLIWTLHALSPATARHKEPLQFLLDHPRRCYTLLFSRTATWALTGILVALNFIDVLLIVTLDLDNPEVNALPLGPRILAAIYQAASARHTGTASFNLANVNPAVQFSLMVMMYISIYPIAITNRMSGSYEDRAVGLFEGEVEADEQAGGTAYLIHHMRNQLSFDLWYVFLGVFCICATESKRIMDGDEPAFSIFSIFFEVVSAYANVGLSLGYPSNNTSLCGHFSVFSKVVICAMMIRGRHRGLPYALDRAITLPSDRLAERDVEEKYRDHEE